MHKQRTISLRLLIELENSLVIVVAHRLATVRRADLVIYLENGAIKAQGSFNEVRKLVPDFDSQAQLMGL